MLSTHQSFCVSASFCSWRVWHCVGLHGLFRAEADIRAVSDSSLVNDVKQCGIFSIYTKRLSYEHIFHYKFFIKCPYFCRLEG